eukprot:scaffold56753_cov45-Attheya_sp.AAC.2
MTLPPSSRSVPVTTNATDLDGVSEEPLFETTEEEEPHTQEEAEAEAAVVIPPQYRMHLTREEEEAIQNQVLAVTEQEGTISPPNNTPVQEATKRIQSLLEQRARLQQGATELMTHVSEQLESLIDLSAVVVPTEEHNVPSPSNRHHMNTQKLSALLHMKQFADPLTTTEEELMQPFLDAMMDLEHLMDPTTTVDWNHLQLSLPDKDDESTPEVGEATTGEEGQCNHLVLTVESPSSSSTLLGSREEADANDNDAWTDDVARESNLIGFVSDMEHILRHRPALPSTFELEFHQRMEAWVQENYEIVVSSSRKRDDSETSENNDDQNKVCLDTNDVIYLTTETLEMTKNDPNMIREKLVSMVRELMDMEEEDEDEDDKVIPLLDSILDSNHVQNAQTTNANATTTTTMMTTSVGAWLDRAWMHRGVVFVVDFVTEQLGGYNDVLDQFMDSLLVAADNHQDDTSSSFGKMVMVKLLTRLGTMDMPPPVQEQVKAAGILLPKRFQ